VIKIRIFEESSIVVCIQLQTCVLKCLRVFTDQSMFLLALGKNREEFGVITLSNEV
jgi:hypothetical protein